MFPSFFRQSEGFDGGRGSESPGTVVEETFVDVVGYKVRGELCVDKGDPIVFAEGVREHASLGGGKLFQCGFGLEVSGDKGQGGL